MQPTTNQPQTQAPATSPKPVLPVDQAMAHLGFVTNMHEQLLQYQAKKAGVQPQGSSQAAPGAPQGPQGQAQPQQEENSLKAVETRLMKEIKGIKESLDSSTDPNKEVADLKKQIEEVLNETD